MSRPTGSSWAARFPDRPPVELSGIADGDPRDCRRRRSTEEVTMTATNRMSPVHPGEILRDEMDERDLSANALAQALDIPANRIAAILNGQRGVTQDTARRLSRYFGTTPELWLNLQKTWELRRAEIG